MNILIINAFGSSPKAKYRFESFCNIIKHLFKKVSKGTGLDNFNYICRSPNQITEFVYKLDMISGDVNQNKKNKKNFDKIDIVIIDGYEKYAPWDKKSLILCEFIKLCKITNKILYAGGVALEILICYLATGSLNEYNFINTKGQIKALEEMGNIPKQYIKQIKLNDNFLDFVTGDILEYKTNKIWVPIKNIGLHKQRTAEKYMSRGKFVLPYKFRGKDYFKNEFTYATVCTEIKVKITKQYLYHYLVENLPLGYIAMTSLTWFPHFFNVNNKTLQFKIICECEKGPVVIEHQNSIGVLFHISEKYQDTVTFMENFIKNKFNEVQNKEFKFKNQPIPPIIKPDKIEMPSIFKTYNSYENIKKGKTKDEEEIHIQRKTNLSKVNDSRAFNRIKKVKSEACHVGLGINNRDMIFVENNYINQNPIFYMGKINKNSFNDLIHEELNMNKLITRKMNKKIKIFKINKNLDKFKNKINLSNINFTKNDIGKKIKRRNLILSSDDKNYNNYINKNINLDYNTLYLHSKNKNLNKEKNKRKKSANIFCNTVNNLDQKIRNKFNLRYKSIYPLFSDFSKKRKKNYFSDNENESDEYYEQYLPKYPRPANLDKDQNIKSSNNNIDILLPIDKNKDERKNEFIENNDINFLNKRFYSLEK